jgi:hypothetical protein
MSDKQSGVIWRVGENKGRYGMMYSIKLDGHDDWHGTKSVDPREKWGVKEGDTVEYEVEKNGKGYWDITSDVVKVEAKPEEGAPADAPAAGSKARESFDRAVNKDLAYNFRAGRAMALDFLKVCVDQDLIEWPAKGGKAAKLQVLRLFLDKYTVEFTKDSWYFTEGGTLDTFEEEIE